MSRADNAQKDGLYGLVDANINYVIQPMYYYLGDVAANGLLMCQVSSSGKTVEEGNHNGLIGIYKYDNDQSTKKYINLEGKTVYMWVESY